ncbi:energy-coupling factor ABC transporter permease [Methanolapillus ohkumae]|uniref:Cobalt transport protein CbiM n=1 Tax=Methanolapillus ohkumae TaxID=3028298 RepID=A0AA96ZX15_9EURY|nr:Cobalt transport protein CbiM [Methanosarcinaceae archaeon Am2]
MHISEGVLPEWLLLAGWVVTIILLAVSLWWGKKHTDDMTKKIPQIAVTTAAFFAACMVRIPLPPTSLHLVLAGLVGILLGPFAFVCIFVGLLLQALLLGNGGLLVLGVNTVVMGLPALLAYPVFVALSKKTNYGISAAVASVFAILLSTLLLAAVFIAGGITFGSMESVTEFASKFMVLSSIIQTFSNSPWLLTFVLLIVMNLPLMIVEGVICAFIVPFIAKVKPEMLPQNK